MSINTKGAIKIAIIYFTISFLWIMFSDRLLLSFLNDSEIIEKYHIHKCLVFIILVSVFIYFFVKKEISKKILYENILQTERFKYKTLFETANDAIYILNDQLLFVDCNNKSLETFECSKDQVIGKTPFDVSPDLQPGKINSYELGLEKINLTKKGKPQYFDWLHTNLKKDKTFLTEVSLNKIEISSTEYFFAIIRDISKRKKVDNILKESEEKYRRLTENSPNITYIYSLKNGALYWSSRVMDILGFDPENLIKDTLIWDNAIHPEDRFEIKSFIENIEVGQSYELEYRIYDIHGKLHWFNDRIFNVYEKDGDIIVEGLISDITRRKETQRILKESEEKYKIQYDYFPKPVYTIKKKNGELIFADINNAARNYPFVKCEDVIGKKVSEFFYRKEEKTLVDILYDVFEKKQDIKLEILYEFKTTGAKRNLSVVAGFVPPDLVLLSTSDITDKKNAQQKLYHAMMNAEERERSRIAKDLHDGISPILSAIKLYIQTLFNAKDEETKNIISKKIYITINEAIQSISDISNRLSPHILQNFGLSVAIQSFIDKVSEVTKIHFSFFYNVNSKLDENIEVNLYRISIELINNTIKYANARNIKIKICEKADIIEMHFEHNGKGFDLEQVRKESKAMGLYNLSNRINLLNGKFDIDTNIDSGVKVDVRIPLRI